MSLPAARTTPIPTTTADRLLIGGALLLHGWAFVETTGADPAELELIDGSGTNGALVVPITLSSGESTRDTFPGTGIGIYTSLFLNIVSGSVRGAVWTTPATIIEGHAFAQGVRPIWSGDE